MLWKTLVILSISSKPLRILSRCIYIKFKMKLIKCHYFMNHCWIILSLKLMPGNVSRTSCASVIMPLVYTLYTHHSTCIMKQFAIYIITVVVVLSSKNTVVSAHWLKYNSHFIQRNSNNWYRNFDIPSR